MAGLLNVATTMMCPHGGQVKATSSNTKVTAAGDFLLRPSDTFLISACPFLLGLVPHPCVQVKWMQPDQRSQAAGDFTLNESSVGMCVAADQAVQGAVQIVVTQQQVSGL